MGQRWPVVAPVHGICSPGWACPSQRTLGSRGATGGQRAEVPRGLPRRGKELSPSPRCPSQRYQMELCSQGVLHLRHHRQRAKRFPAVSDTNQCGYRRQRSLPSWAGNHTSGTPVRKNTIYPTGKERKLGGTNGTVNTPFIHASGFYWTPFTGRARHHVV